MLIGGPGLIALPVAGSFMVIAAVLLFTVIVFRHSRA